MTERPLVEQDLRRVIGVDGEPDRRVDGLGRRRAPRAPPLARPPAHVRRAVGRVPQPGPDRHVRDLPRPRGDPGRRRPRPRASATGSSRATASRRSACSAVCRRRRSSSGGAATRRAGGTPRTSTSPRSACRSATQVPHAAGLAWGLRLKGSDAVAVVLFGDGATSEGSFHEGANLAAVMRAPLVLLCNNNQWAISTPLSAQTAAARLADKAIGYGMPAIRVDGHDVLAVFEAVREGVARARAGDGPTFVEAVTYRSAPHATADDPSLYIDPERVADGAGARLRRRCTRATSRGSACSTTSGGAVEAGGARGDARGHPAGRGRAAGRPGARVRARVRRPAAGELPATSTSCGGCTRR